MSPAKVAPAKKGRVDLDLTRESLLQLGPEHTAERVADLLTDAVKTEAPVHWFLDRLLGEEIRRRDEGRIKTSLRLSELPTGYALANFDWAFQPSVEKSQIETLATCAWIRERETFLIQRPPGVGKSHLGVALA